MRPAPPALAGTPLLLLACTCRSDSARCKACPAWRTLYARYLARHKAIATWPSATCAARPAVPAWQALQPCPALLGSLEGSKRDPL